MQEERNLLLLNSETMQIKLETGETVEFTETLLKFPEPDGSTVLLTPAELVQDEPRMQQFLAGAVAARIVKHTEEGTQIYYSRSLRVVEFGEPLPAETAKVKKPKPEAGEIANS